MINQVDVLVIGAGQAGLAVGYYLKQHNRNFILIDREEEIGVVWRKRYDSLVLFTPRSFSSLPGLALEGDPNGYATKDEISNYLQDYARTFDIPVSLNTEVYGLEETLSGFKVQTNQGVYLANKVVVAAGPFQKANIPEMSSSLSSDVYQVHSSEYLNPSQLKEGNTLIVGAGNSGAQIAVELSKEREIYLSIGHKMRFFPLEHMGKNIFWWFQKLGVLSASINTALGQFISKQPDPIFGKQLKTLIHQGVVHMKPRAVEIHNDHIKFEDHSLFQVKNIIWSTGFYSDYSWINIPGALNGIGKPYHQRGVSPIKGLFYIGLPWQYRRGSALIGGVGQDAKYIFESL